MIPRTEGLKNRGAGKGPTADLQPTTGPCNCTSLRKAMRRVTQLYDAALAPSGLKITQRSILNHIYRAGAPTLTELSVALVMDRGALTHNLKPLERDGLVRIEVDLKDRRTRRILLSPAGHAKLRETAELWENAQRGFEAGIGEAEAAALRATMGLLISSEFTQTFQHTTGLAAS